MNKQLLTPVVFYQLFCAVALGVVFLAQSEQGIGLGNVATLIVGILGITSRLQVSAFLLLITGAMPTGGNNGAVANDAFTRQAQVYAKLFEIFGRHAKSIERVTLWGINDPRSWKSGQQPLLFDGQMKPKPAYQAILDIAEKTPFEPKNN